MNKILVVMPVYNAEKTLADAIRSILKQTHRNLKLIIVDDNSSDSSLEIAKSFMTDKRVFVYHNNKNMGAYYSRNVGLFVSKDEDWDCFTTHDADDISYPRRYENLLKTLRRNVVAVQDTFIRKDLKTKEVIDESLTMAHALFKRKVFNDIGYFEEVRFGGDWEYWTRLRSSNARQKLTTANCRVAMGDSFIHGNNLTVTIPIGSSKRTAYINSTRKRIEKLEKTGSFYQTFSFKSKITTQIKE